MGSLFFFIPVLLYIGLLAGFVYAVYRMVDGWVNKSIEVRREQNALLSKLIDAMERKGGNADPATDQNETL